MNDANVIATDGDFSSWPKGKKGKHELSGHLSDMFGEDTDAERGGTATTGDESVNSLN